MAAALLFDLDGTIVDTDHLHFASFQAAFAPHGVTIDWRQYRERIMGAPNSAIAAEFLGHVPASEHGPIMDAKEAAYRGRIGAIAPAAGLIELLDWADAEGVPCAVVTNAPRANAELVLGALSLRGRLARLVIGGELPRGKPDPLPYLTALGLTGAEAAHSVAFEDSISGVRSAVAAGLAVVGMTTSLDERALLELGATLAAADFTDARILALIRERMARSAQQVIGEAGERLLGL